MYIEVRQPGNFFSRKNSCVELQRHITQVPPAVKLHPIDLLAFQIPPLSPPGQRAFSAKQAGRFSAWKFSPRARPSPPKFAAASRSRLFQVTRPSLLLFCCSAVAAARSNTGAPPRRAQSQAPLRPHPPAAPSSAGGRRRLTRRSPWSKAGAWSPY